MKKSKVVLILIVLFFPFSVHALATNASNINYVRVYYYCPEENEKCKTTQEWLKEYETQEEQVVVNQLEEELYQKIKASFQIKNEQTPFVLVGTNLFFGLNQKKIEKAIKSYEQASSYCDPIPKIQKEEDLKECQKENKGIYKEFSFYPYLFLILGISLFLIWLISFKKIKITNKV